MFHKYALIINCVLVSLCGISMIPIQVSSSCEWYLFQIKFIPLCLFVLFFISVVIVFISIHLVTVNIGRPVLERLFIAYKFSNSDSISTSVIQSSHDLFPSKDKVQICYEQKSGPFGIAYGIVFPDQISDEERFILASHGYNIFKTKPISNAVYISSPTFPWLSYFGHWLILTAIYPKLYKYSKAHKLSAYPVVELYRRFSVTLIAPLSQQDVFVVPEAEGLMHRSKRHLDTLDTSVTERSLSTSYHSTRVKLSEAAVISKLTPRRSLSPIENVNTKISPTMSNSYTAKIILKRSLTPAASNDAKPVILRTSTPLESKGHARGE